MSFSFRPARREKVGLIIGVMGPTGSGKTYSALRLAKGMSGGARFAVIDTEAGRAKHYADRFEFDHGDLHPPFRPEAYSEAVSAADQAGYPVVVVDSTSHVWAGDGGVLDWQEEELERMAGQDWKRREACKIASWIRPKIAHKHMLNRLLQLRCHLILCFRAEQKIEMRRDETTGKIEIVEKAGPTSWQGWTPICEKNLPYEMTASFLLSPERPGVAQPIKLQEQHRALLEDGVPLSEEIGAGFARWAAGDDAKANGEATAQGDTELTVDDIVIPDGKNRGRSLRDLNGRELEWYTNHYRDLAAKPGPKRLAHEKLYMACLQASAQRSMAREPGEDAHE